MFVQRSMTGALFANEKRTEINNQPNAKGRALIAGKSYFISAWTGRRRTVGDFNRYHSKRLKAMLTRNCRASRTRKGNSTSVKFLSLSPSPLRFQAPLSRRAHSPRVFRAKRTRNARRTRGKHLAWSLRLHRASLATLKMSSTPPWLL